MCDFSVSESNGATKNRSASQWQDGKWGGTTIESLHARVYNSDKNINNENENENENSSSDKWYLQKISLIQVIKCGEGEPTTATREYSFMQPSLIDSPRWVASHVNVHDIAYIPFCTWGSLALTVLSISFSVCISGKGQNSEPKTETHAVRERGREPGLFLRFFLDEHPYLPILQFSTFLFCVVARFPGFSVNNQTSPRKNWFRCLRFSLCVFPGPSLTIYSPSVQHQPIHAFPPHRAEGFSQQCSL